MSGTLDTVRRLRAVAPTQLRRQVRSVVVILSNSRSGSSLLYNLLAGHPGFASLDGEIEPLLALTGNGYGYNSDSDALGTLADPDGLADNLFAELSLEAPARAAPGALQQAWTRRLLLQFPALFAEPARRRDMAQALEAALAGGDADAADDAPCQARVLAAVFRDDAWRRGYYDGAAAGAAPYFDEPLKIEEPPFVVPRLRRRPYTAQDAAHKALLFKAPADAYRIGLYEQLFPQAQIRYLHLTRGYAQSVNGLMDGWLSPQGFFSHDMAGSGTPLAIGGYSDILPFGKRWWKFDLPPNWRAFAGARLEEVCLNQWLSAHRAILDSGVAALRIAFEDFLAAPAALMGKVTAHLGLPALALPGALPVMMATEAPQPMRWEKRAGLLLNLGERRAVRDMMAQLGYAMNPATWR